MSDHMPTPKEFLSDFTKDLVQHPGNRPELIAGWAKHMEAREEAIARIAMQREHDRPMRVPVAHKLSFAPEPLDPAASTLEYEWTTVGRYLDEREQKASREWYEKHRQATVLVLNQDGDALYALYVSPLGSHNESVDHLFKVMRSVRYSEDEELAA